jgi:hypothetical protein
MRSELELEAEIESQLKKAKWEYEKEVVCGDAWPDFVVTTQAGDRVVVEVKAWESTPENLGRALNQAQRYKELSRLDAALVVTAAGLAVPTESGGVVPVAQFLSTLASLADKLAQTRRKVLRPQTLKPHPTKMVFASMPFHASYDDTFLVAIEPAALRNDAVAKRVDHKGTAMSSYRFMP